MIRTQPQTWEQFERSLEQFESRRQRRSRRDHRRLNMRRFINGIWRPSRRYTAYSYRSPLFNSLPPPPPPPPPSSLRLTRHNAVNGFMNGTQPTRLSF